MQKSCVHLYYGDGKGKTTAAIGLGLRACGRGKKVLLVQFLKDYESGEIIALDCFNQNYNIFKGEPVKKFIMSMTDAEKEKTYIAQHQIFLDSTEKCINENIDMVIFDELIDAVNLNIIEIAEVKEFIKNKPDNLEVVITGHNPRVDFLEFSDYVTEFKKIKHPYDKGLPSRPGIEK